MEQVADIDPAGAAARLAEAAAEGGPVEIILVVKGTVRPVEGSGGRRWRVRLDRHHALTFRAEWVVAASPVAARKTR